MVCDRRSLCPAFPSKTGMPAKPLRTALGSLIIQKQYGYSDRELVEQITENTYYQYFIGLPGYQQEQPFATSLLVEFRKRLTDEILGDINEMIIDFNHPEDHPPKGGSSTDEPVSEEMVDPQENEGNPILDATCAPQQIAFPFCHPNMMYWLFGFSGHSNRPSMN